jgi:hypothetical protein
MAGEPFAAQHGWLPLREFMREHQELLPTRGSPLRVGQPIGPWRLETMFGSLRGPQAAIEVRVRPDLLSDHDPLPSHEWYAFELQETPSGWNLRHTPTGRLLFDVQVRLSVKTAETAATAVTQAEPPPAASLPEQPPAAPPPPPAQPKRSHRRLSAKSEALDDEAFAAIVAAHTEIPWFDPLVSQTHHIGKLFWNLLPDLPGQRPAQQKRKAERLLAALRRWQEHHGAGKEPLA